MTSFLFSYYLVHNFFKVSFQSFQVIQSQVKKAVLSSFLVADLIDQFCNVFQDCKVCLVYIVSLRLAHQFTHVVCFSTCLS